MNKRYGTDRIDGLNVEDAPHQIGDGELIVSENGWTSQSGAWHGSNGRSSLYTQADMACFAAGRMNGALHLVYVAGTTLYDNGASAGTVPSGATKIVPLDDQFLIIGGATNYLYDGDHVREQGTWQTGGSAHDSAVITVTSVAAVTISAVAQSTTTTFTTSAHTLADGDKVYISGMTGLSEMNGRVHTVYGTPADSTHFVVNEDSSGYSTYSSGGNVYEGGAGLSGDYRYYLVPTIELKSGRLLTGKPIGYRTDGVWSDSLAPSVLSLSPNDMVTFEPKLWWGTAAGGFEYTISGTIGTDYKPGLSVYRTKADGSDFYLLQSWQDGDAGFSSPGVVGYYYAAVQSDTTHDEDLGAVYTAGVGDHGNPPASDLAALSGQRLLLNDTSNPDRLYFNHLDGLDYYHTLGWVQMPDSVTAVETVRGKHIAASVDRMWEITFPGGIPMIKEIPTSMGLPADCPTTVTEDGLMFLLADGLYLFDGVRVNKISRKAFASIASPACVAAAGDLLYVSGSSDAYIAQRKSNGWTWHAIDQNSAEAMSTAGTIYARLGTSVYQMFAGSVQNAQLQTKSFGGLSPGASYRLVVDLEGAGTTLVQVMGNEQSDSASRSATGTGTGRRLVRVPVGGFVNEWASVKLWTVGDVTVYGMVLEVER